MNPLPETVLGVFGTGIDCGVDTGAVTGAVTGGKATTEIN
jgi:hypothetical protein